MVWNRLYSGILVGKQKIFLCSILYHSVWLNWIFSHPNQTHSCQTKNGQQINIAKAFSFCPYRMVQAFSRPHSLMLKHAVFLRWFFCFKALNKQLICCFNHQSFFDIYCSMCVESEIVQTISYFCCYYCLLGVILTGVIFLLFRSFLFVSSMSLKGRLFFQICRCWISM